jgi:hypothetical protein
MPHKKLFRNAPCLCGSGKKYKASGVMPNESLAPPVREDGWAALLQTLAAFHEEDLLKKVTIRREEHS